MNGAPVLTLDRVSKIYCANLVQASRYALRDMLMPWRRDRLALRPGEFLALDAISLSLMPGEIVGVIGGRRAGRSTLAGLAGGLLDADGGTVARPRRTVLVNGVTAGMRPVLTLRENARFRAALYGLDAGEAARLAEAALEFAGAAAEAGRLTHDVDPRLARNVGMAIALGLRPDLFVFDDLPSFGGMPDEEAAARMLDAALDGRAALLVTRNRKLVERYAARCLVLDRGRIVFDGPVADALRLYETLDNGESVAALDEEDGDDNDDGDGDSDSEDTLDEGESGIAATAGGKVTAEEKQAQKRERQKARLLARQPTAQARRIVINGIDLLAGTHRLIARPGETLTLDILVAIAPDLPLDRARLAVNQAGIETSFMQAPLPLALAAGADTADGERLLAVRGTVALPALYHNQYGLALFLPKGDEPPSRINTVKLAVIGIYGAAAGGSGLPLAFTGSASLED